MLDSNGSGPPAYRTDIEPSEIPEALMRDRLAAWLKSNHIAPRKIVNTEYIVQGIEGYIDVVADDEAWELKIGLANAHDVYRLFMYMDISKMPKGFLVALSFSAGAQVAQAHIEQAYGKTIVLTPLDDYPINHPPSDQERSDYY